MAGGTPLWNREDDKKYYEAELQKKVIYIPNLSYFLQAIHLQTLKLPHEIQDPTQNVPSGQTKEDIEESVVRGAKMAFAMSAPLRRMMKEAQEQRGASWKDYSKKPKNYDEALEMLEWLYNLYDDLDMLNQRVITMDLPDIEAYDRDLETEEIPDAAPDRKMPAPVPAADGKAVGEMAGKE